MKLKSVSTIVATLLVLLYSASATSATETDVAKSQVTEHRKPTTWKFDSEQAWIVDSIGRDITEMLIYAKYHRNSSFKQTPDSLKFTTKTLDKSLNKYQFKVTLPNATDPLTYEFLLDGYVWNPFSYCPFAQKLVNSLELKSDTASSIPNNFLKILSDADMKTLFTENERISEALSKNPLDANLHQQAALLQATFEMLEFADHFSDMRPTLSRMSAHLAITQCLSPKNELDLSGKIADIALECMSGRTASSVAKGELLSKLQTNANVKSWLRALKIRSTGDYRIFDEPNSTQLEASQYGVQLAICLSANKALEYIAKHESSSSLRWMRIALYGVGSVESGHQINAHIFPAELNDFKEDYEAYNHDGTKSQFRLSAELNKTATRCLQTINDKPQLVALSWDDVAAYHTRHIVNAVVREYNFYEHSLSIPDAANAKLALANSLLNGMNFLPLIYITVNIDDLHKYVNQLYFSGMEDLYVKRPEIVNSYEWSRMVYRAEHAEPPIPIKTQPDWWFSPVMPMGTAFDFDDRMSFRSYQDGFAEVTRLRTLCPQDEKLCTQWVIEKYGAQPTAAQFKEAYGLLAEFKPNIMDQIAIGDYNNAQNYVSQIEKIAAIVPEYNFTLGEYFVQHNEPEKAARYLQLGIDKSKDAVFISNQSSWLVNYYHAHNQAEKALELAKQAANTCSKGGLNCLAQLLERMGNLNEAETTYIKAKNRYGFDGDLEAFYVRNKDKNKSFAEKADSILKEIFPSGLRKIDETQLKSAPIVGLKIDRLGPFQNSLGLRKGYIMVALNDLRVDNNRQYALVRMMATDYRIKCTYWDGKRYSELVVPTVNDNKIGVGIEDFPKKPGVLMRMMGL